MRATNGTVHRKRRKKIMKAASGFRGGRHRLYRTANQAVMKAGMHGFASRRQKKRQYRALWITRINAGLREHGVSYSRFIDNLLKAQVQLNRKMLAELALSEPEAFAELVSTTRA